MDDDGEAVLEVLEVSADGDWSSLAQPVSTRVSRANDETDKYANLWCFFTWKMEDIDPSEIMVRSVLEIP